MDILEKISIDVKDMMLKVEGTREVTTSIEEGVPEVHVNIDKNRASQYGLTSYGIATGVSSTLSGKRRQPSSLKVKKSML